MSARGVLGVLAAITIVSLLSGIVGAVLGAHVGHSTYSVSYADFISILLTSISLMLAILALMVGIFAIIGWTSLSSKVKKDTHEFLRKGFQPGEPLHKLLVNERNKVPFEGTPPFDKKFAEDEEAEKREDQHD